MKKGEPVDLAVGIMVHVKVGDYVESGQPLFVIHARDEDSLHEAKEKLQDAVKMSPIRVEPLPHFHGVIKS
jgi:pyrimidine-nucleoside phosphorylase